MNRFRSWLGQKVSAAHWLSDDRESLHDDLLARYASYVAGQLSAGRFEKTVQRLEQRGLLGRHQLMVELHGRRLLLFGPYRNAILRKQAVLDALVTDGRPGENRLISDFSACWLINANPYYKADREVIASLLDDIPETFVDLLRRDVGWLVLDAAFEGHRDDQFRQAIVTEMVDRYGCADDRIVYLTENARLRDVRGTHYANRSLVDMAIEAWERPEGTPEVRGGEFEKRFLFLNHVPRPHRAAMLLKLAEAGLLDQGIVSFNHAFDSSHGKLESGKLRRFFPNLDVQPYQQLYASVARSLPLEVDAHGFAGRNDESYKDMVFKPPVDIYNRSLFSIVSETAFDQSVVRFTEKTLKPMLGFHPFVVLGAPGTLRLLRELGFRTFHPTIDESYDDIVEGRERIDCLLGEIRRLCALEGQQVAAWRANLSETLEHNQRHFYRSLPGISRDMLSRIFD